MSKANVVDSSDWLEYFSDSKQAGQVIALDSVLALEAARHAPPLADSIIYAVALRHDATLWTQDEHFRGLPQVRFPTGTKAP